MKRCVRERIGASAFRGGMVLLLAAGSLAADSLAGRARAEDAAPPFETVSLRGRIVWLHEALERRYGIKPAPDALERVVALETADGRLWPIIEDVRGHAFRLDPRLGEGEIELLARRYAGAPAIQVVRLYAWREDGRYELDYWCEICAIAMYDLRPCDCCQGPIELRARPAPAESAP